MRSSPPNIRHIAAWIIIPSVAIRILLIWTGACEGSLLADDAYYYFTIAKHIAAGLGPTFDGISPTNGFQPLWQFIVVPFFAWTSSLWTPVRLALTLAVACDVVSGVFIIRLARRISPTTATTWVAAVLWFLFPTTVLIGLRGMEASLATMLVLATALIAARSAERGLHWSGAVWTGVAVALCGLARTDNLPAVGLAVASAASLGNLHASRRHAVVWTALTAAVAALLVAPWFVWNELRFGTLIQVSGLMKLQTGALYGALPAWGHGPPAAATAVAHRLLAPILTPTRFLVGEEFHSSWVTPALTLAVTAMFAVPGLVGALSCRLGTRAPVAFVGTWLLVHVVLFGFIWQSYASWYSLTALALLTVLASTGITAWIDGGRSQRRLGYSVLALTAVASIAMYSLCFARLSFQANSPEARFGPRLATVAAAYPGAVVGAFNAGAPGYASTRVSGVSVVNLDGLVNNRVYDAVRAGRYVDYVLATVDVLLEPPERASLFLGPDELRSLVQSYPRATDGMWHRAIRNP